MLPLPPNPSFNAFLEAELMNSISNDFSCLMASFAKSPVMACGPPTRDSSFLSAVLVSSYCNFSRLYCMVQGS